MSATPTFAQRPAVFLDKDGTLIENVPYNVDVSRIRLYPETVPVLRALAARGYLLLIVSNQPGISLGYFDASAVERAGHALIEMLRARGVAVAGFYYCPHRPASCDCHKPQPGLLLRAAGEHGVDLGGSWMVGDILNDVEAGQRAGCRALLVDRGNETEWLDGPLRRPQATVTDLRGVLEHIPDCGREPRERTA